MTGTVLIVGAAGDVGQGIVRAARAEGRTVIAAGRDAGRLERLYDTSSGVHRCVGDLGSEAGALALWHTATALAGPIDAVVLSVNAPNRVDRLAQWSSNELAALLAANLLTHFNAARTMLPLLPPQGMLLGIGGGTADIVLPGLAPLSIVQGGLRMLYRGLAREQRDGPHVRELIVASMVNGASKRDAARPEWLTDDEIGRHVCAILTDPASFPGPILRLAERSAVARPEALVEKEDERR